MASALTSMAILKVNADRYGRDTLENFLPLVCDRLFHGTSDVVSLPDLKSAIATEYGLAIPGGVLQTLTKRCAKRGLLKREAGVLHIDRDKLERYDLSAERADTQREQASLVAAGVEFARAEFSRELAQSDFEDALHLFIQANTAPLLATVIDGAPLAEQPDDADGGLPLIVAAFVTRLAKQDPERFRYLGAVVKGAVLASSLYFPSTTTFEQRLTNLAVYLDTTLLLRAVGASGPELQELAAEVLSLAVLQGARLFCFAHTLREVQGVLESCSNAVKRRTGTFHGEATEYMVAAGWTYTDVVELSEKLEDELARLHIAVVEKPAHVERLTFDETRLEELLEEEIHYRNPAARRKDVDSITAIYRIRRGEETTSLSRSRAIFVTHNSQLVAASRRYAHIEEIDRETVPLCVQDFVFTSILWLMRPLEAPDLPIRALVADCYAAMRADDSTWHQYVVKIEQLREGRRVTEDDYILLRQSLQVRALILVDTKGDPAAFTEGSVDRVLRKAHENITAAAEEDTAKARQEETIAKAELARVQDESAAKIDIEQRIAAARTRQLDEAVGRVARVGALAVLGVLAVAAFVGALFSLPALTDHHPSGYVGLAVSACVVIVSGLGLYGALTEKGLPSIGRALVRWMTPVVRRWLVS